MILPGSLDGFPLSPEASERLKAFVAAYRFDRPLRPAPRTLALAVSVLRQTCRVEDGVWRTRSTYRFASGQVVAFRLV